MNPIIIYAVVGVLAASVLLSIPFMIANARKKKKAAAFVEGNRDQAVLHVYGESITIDGQKGNTLDSMRGENMQLIVTLPAGRHVVSAKYSTSSVGLGGNVNYKTPKPIESELDLEAGHEYSIGIYFYNPEERKNYYKGDVGEDISTQELSISGLGGYSKAYIICYKEK